MSKSAYISKEVVEQSIVLKDEADFKSHILILIQHNGFRRGKLHLLLGTSGGGKSTLVRTMLLDALACNKRINIGIVLSEETEYDFVVELSSAAGIDMPFLKRVFIYQEIISKDISGRDNLRSISSWVDENDIDLIFYDNLTTSRYYADVSPKDQSSYVIELKRIVIEKNIACLCVAHTKAGIADNSDHLIDVSDIRGSKTISNLVEFLYILQRFQVDDRYFPFLSLKKYRGYVPESLLFFLKFDYGRKCYVDFIDTNFGDFKKIFKKRNKLK